MIVLVRHVSTETTDGNLSQAVWQPARLCISLFRSHRHSRVPPPADAAGAHRPFLPRRAPRLPDHQRRDGQTHAGVPAVGRGVCAQPPHRDRMGRRQSPQGERAQARRLRPTVRHPHGAAQAIRPVLHPQEPGTRPQVWRACPEVPHRRPELPDRDAAAVALLQEPRGAHVRKVRHVPSGRGLCQPAQRISA
jgi:hypothetical protein